MFISLWLITHHFPTAIVSGSPPPLQPTRGENWQRSHGARRSSQTPAEGFPDVLTGVTVCHMLKQTRQKVPTSCTTLTVASFSFLCVLDLIFMHHLHVTQPRPLHTSDQSPEDGHKRGNLSWISLEGVSCVTNRRRMFYSFQRILWTTFKSNQLFVCTFLILQIFKNNSYSKINCSQNQKLQERNWSHQSWSCKLIKINQVKMLLMTSLSFFTLF